VNESFVAEGETSVINQQGLQSVDSNEDLDHTWCLTKNLEEFQQLRNAGL